MLASKCTLNPTHPGRLASATPPLKMEGNCFSEKQRVFVILPKEHLWWISADRHAFGGYPISSARNAHGVFLPRERHFVDFAIRFLPKARLWRISSEGTPLADFDTRFLPIGTPLVDFDEGILLWLP
jgi:hypothetical protein